jgi:hypothetical protein
MSKNKVLIILCLGIEAGVKRDGNNNKSKGNGAWVIFIRTTGDK